MLILQFSYGNRQSNKHWGTLIRGNTVFSLTCNGISVIIITIIHINSKFILSTVQPLQVGNLYKRGTSISGEILVHTRSFPYK